MFSVSLLSLQAEIPLLFVLTVLCFFALVKLSLYCIARDYVQMVKDEGKWHIVVEKEWIGELCLAWLPEVES